MELDTSGCVDKESFCSMNLDFCANEAIQAMIQGTCTRTCCSVLTGPHRRRRKRDLQEKMRAMGPWKGVCSARCPVDDSEEDQQLVELRLLARQQLEEGVKNGQLDAALEQARRSSAPEDQPPAAAAVTPAA